MGLSAIAITDHDSIEGIRQLVNTAPSQKPELITGVEISCEPPEEFKYLGSIHLLGYGFSLYDKNLNQVLENAKTARADRNPAIIRKLQASGFDITMEELEKRFGRRLLGRPHIAELMQEKGLVSSFDEAFDHYLGKGKPAYVEKYKISCAEAIKRILEAGGLPVLAHPGLLDFNRESNDDAVKNESRKKAELFIDNLIKCGLEGIEVYYTEHDPETTAWLQGVAEKKHLTATGGSDFHGTFNQGVKLGEGKNNLKVSDSLFQKLNVRLEKIKSEHSDLKTLENNLGYAFKNISLLKTALCHRSYLNENRAECESDNERFEFLGDAVLDLCTGHLLMQRCPFKTEGELSKMRAGIVSEPALADLARSIDLGRFVKLGKGEALSRGSEKNSILSDAFEAVMAAVYLDSDFDTAFRIVSLAFKTKLEEIVSEEGLVDFKSLLQELSQETSDETPQYSVLNESGPDHDKIFEVGLKIFEIETTGSGKNKKAAEQECARKALSLLKQAKA